MKKNNVESFVWLTVILGTYLSFHSGFALANIPGYCFLGTITLCFSIYFVFSTKHIFFEKGLLFSFFLWNLLSVFWAHDISTASGGIIRCLIFVLLVYCISNAFIRYKNFAHHVGTSSLLAIVIISVIYSISNLQLTSQPHGFSYPFGNPNIGAVVIAFGIIIAIVNLVFKRSVKSSFFFIVILLLLCYQLYYLQSKATIICLFFSLFFVWSIHSRKRIAFAVTTSLVGLIGIFPILPNLLNRIWPSVEVRLFIWTDTLKMIFHTPFTTIFGWGSGSFFLTYPTFKSQESFQSIYSTEFVDYPHCYLLETASELGIIGGILFSLIFICSIWQLVVKCRQKQASKNDYIFCILLIFLFTHAQISVAFSYLQIQLLAATAIGWCIATSNSKKFCKVPSKIVLLCFLGSIIIWKFYILDVFLFHFNYKNAFNTASRNRQQGLQQMIGVDLPIYENYFTIEWRHRLGSLLVDTYEKWPIFVTENMSTFDEMHQKIPGYGYYWLKKAIFYAKSNNLHLANKNFVLFSKQNPFALNLWIYWGIACNKGQATTTIMEKNVDILLTKYPRDGRLFFGKGIVQLLQKKDPKEYFNQARKWSKKQHDQIRAKKIMEWTEEIYQYINKK